MVKLKACPFCGEPPSTAKRQDESLFSHEVVWWYSVECEDCDVGFSSEYEEEAIDRWNMRKRPKKVNNA